MPSRQLPYRKTFRHFRIRKHNTAIASTIGTTIFCLISLSVTAFSMSHVHSNVQSSHISHLVTLPEENSSHPNPCKLEKPLYVFLHLHKTGGNSIKTALYAFAKKNNLNLFHTCHSPPTHSWISILPYGIAQKQHPMHCNLDQLLSLSPRQKADIDIVMGHQYFGVHNLFPHRTVRYFTFLRNPVSRKISHYHHFESNTTSPDPSKFFDYLLYKNRNYAVKRLSTNGISNELWTDIRSRILDVNDHARQSALHAAKHHLTEHFFFVGLQEQFEQSACILSELLNVACGRSQRLVRNAPMKGANITRQHENVRGRNAPPLNSIPTKLLDMTREMEHADVSLYEFARELYKLRLQDVPKCRKLYNTY